MKNLFYILFVSAFIFSCGSTQENALSKNKAETDTIRIANDSLDFELIVFDSDFESWLATQPPIEFYELEYLEKKNRHYVMQYNIRARNPARYGRLYPQPINYESDVDYGLELNYMLYNYFEYFQEKYNQRL